MFEIIIREVIPTVAKSLSDLALKAVTEYPVETAAVFATGAACYQMGRADTYEKIIDKKNAFLNC